MFQENPLAVLEKPHLMYLSGHVFPDRHSGHRTLAYDKLFPGTGKTHRHGFDELQNDSAIFLSCLYNLWRVLAICVVSVNRLLHCQQLVVPFRILLVPLVDCPGGSAVMHIGHGNVRDQDQHVFQIYQWATANGDANIVAALRSAFHNFHNVRQNVTGCGATGALFLK
jgi:hypothetical protein